MDRPRRFSGLPAREMLGVTVPVAVTRRARLLGLALLRREGAGPGLLIPACRGVHTLGMRFDLDVLFLDVRGRVLDLRRSLPPGRLAHCPGADAVLELPAPGSRPGGGVAGVEVDGTCPFPYS